MRVMSVRGNSKFSMPSINSSCWDWADWVSAFWTGIVSDFRGIRLCNRWPVLVGFGGWVGQTSLACLLMFVEARSWAKIRFWSICSRSLPPSPQWRDIYILTSSTPDCIVTNHESEISLMYSFWYCLLLTSRSLPAFCRVEFRPKGTRRLRT